VVGGSFAVARVSISLRTAGEGPEEGRELVSASSCYSLWVLPWGRLRTLTRASTHAARRVPGAPVCVAVQRTKFCVRLAWAAGIGRIAGAFKDADEMVFIDPS
jgi:hypothetical protein